MKPKDIENLSTKKATLDDICILTGVPKAILSLTTGETFANSDAAIRIFLNETINPLIKRLETAFAQFVDEKYTLHAFISEPQSQEQKLKLIESGITNHYMTTNEARAIAGMEKIDNGDSIMMPFNLIEHDNKQASTEEKSVKKKYITHCITNRCGKSITRYN